MDRLAAYVVHSHRLQMNHLVSGVCVCVCVIIYSQLSVH